MSAHPIAVQYPAGRRGVPSARRIRSWAGAALREAGRESASVTVRVVNESEGRDLNARFRHVDRPTNVLAFPSSIPAIPTGALEEAEALGDVVVCAPVVAAEAHRYGLAPAARWAHMVVHGTLHLCGLDHRSRHEAAEMERREARVLTGLGFPDPYA